MLKPMHGSHAYSTKSRFSESLKIGRAVTDGKLPTLTFDLHSYACIDTHTGIDTHTHTHTHTHTTYTQNTHTHKHIKLHTHTHPT